MVTIILFIFFIGYAAIVAEHKINVDKAATALLTGVGVWTVIALSATDGTAVELALGHHFKNAAEILFFLLGAMTIVELIDAHDGFDFVVRRLQTHRKQRLFWSLGLFTFFASALLDNLTTTIVMISFLQKMVKNRDERLLLSAIIVLAANAGGAWSPIGDITTTMLWIGKQVSASELMLQLFLPSLVSLIVPMLFLSKYFKNNFEEKFDENINENNHKNIENASKTGDILGGGQISERHQKTMLFAGILSLIFVPVFKLWTHLPPFMGMLLALGALWLLSELLHSERDHAERAYFTPASALRRIDTPSVLFFLGILLAIGGLEQTGLLKNSAIWLDTTVKNSTTIAVLIGIVSAVIDNVPLVSATMSMYSTAQYPQNHDFWQLVAFCAGTGGSMLVIGSAAGVAAMSLERISFFWYVKHISWLALLGYFVGIGVFLLQKIIFY